MVCKEDVISWFKDSESYNRIDVLYELLKMCLPFELRFLGSCVEEIGKHTYLELHGPTLDANDLDKLSKDSVLTTQGLLNDTVRHKVIIYLSLLSSRNYSVANWLYKNTLRTDWLEDYIVKGNVKDDNLLSEFLLLFVMALHHPAFRFEQKCYFAKILAHLIEFRDNRSRVSPKTSMFSAYPPGLGYPSNKLHMSPCPEVPIIPVKTPCGADTLHQHPPGLPPPELLTWNRPGIPCGAPEVPPPFPQSTASPLVSQSASPIHSRSNSPHLPPPSVPMRFGPMLPHHFPPPHIPLEQSIPPPPLHYKLPDEESNLMSADKPIIECWNKEQKPPNGVRLQMKGRSPYFVDHFQELTLTDGENYLHRNSNSSSGSSPNPSPPETPAPPCPSKARINGMGGFTAAVTSSPPPPSHQQTFNSCSVPYTTYPTSFPPIPNRSMYPSYTQSYRPPFAPPFPPTTYPTNDTSFQPYTLPFMSMVYSSPQYPSRSPNCYNCGAMGHAGQDCTSQNIDDLTQMTTYALEYAAPSLPDPDK